ncbi:MAG TPA: deferrochelatase/peroxidase EfeB [Candidatus Luteococcus avicola]|nr:deferrochelatase/peroxidase EfeB [Candidatus Luteococcus avicola]
MVSRRGVLGGAAAGAAALGTGFLAGRDSASGDDDQQAAASYSFTGEHQAGIVTPAQDRLHFASLDLDAGERGQVVQLPKDWTAAARLMTQGKQVGEGRPEQYEAPPSDTGEAVGLSTAGLTITFGFGPGLFTANGKDRYGLANNKPEALEDLPHFPGDLLDASRTGGDLCIQACADDPQVAVHAIRNLTRIAFGRAHIRWSQLGFGRTSSTSTTQDTPRNLFGFKDGTNNLKLESPDLLAEHLWVKQGADPAADWLAGGSYLVARRIHMLMETWDRASLSEQETVFGRTKAAGAPLSGGEEFTAPDFALQGRGGAPMIDVRSHMALAHPSANDGAQMLRRGYNYVDGNDALGRLDAGLFFLAYVCDPRTHYIPVQNRLAKNDRLNEYLRHTGSGLWAVPPGVGDQGYVGETLFES